MQEKNFHPRTIFDSDASPFLMQDVAKQRGGFGAERYETEEFQEKVRNLLSGKRLDTCSRASGFESEALCAQVREHFDTLRYDDGDLWEMVDANRTQDEVADMVAEIAIRKAAQVTGNSIFASISVIRACLPKL